MTDQGKEIYRQMIAAQAGAGQPNPAVRFPKVRALYLPSLDARVDRAPRVTGNVRPTDRILRTSVAQLPLLPEPLKLLHGPLIITVETWSDGTVFARLPIAALGAEGSDDTGALEDLGEAILAWVQGIVDHGGRDALGGPLLRQWDAICALIDVGGVAKS